MGPKPDRGCRMDKILGGASQADEQVMIVRINGWTSAAEEIGRWPTDFADEVIAGFLVLERRVVGRR